MRLLNSVAVVMLVCMGTHASAADLFPIYELAKGKATKEKIQAFLDAGEVEVGPYSFASGRVDYLQQFPETKMCSCVDKANGFEVTNTEIRFRCDYECWYLPQLAGAPLGPVDDLNQVAEKRIVSIPNRLFVLRVLYVDSSSLVVRDQDENRVGSVSCSVLRPREKMRRCGAAGGGDTGYLLEILPSTKRERMLSDVKAELTGLPSYRCKSLLYNLNSFNCSFRVFMGPPAKRPRRYTEVFYVGESMKQRAIEVAKVLSGTIGEVEVLRWPGAWDYDVVVVVGDEKRPTAAENGPPSNGSGVRP